MDAPTAPATTPAATAPAAAKKMSLAEYYQAWEARTRAMTEASAAADWSGTDFRKLKAKDVGVSMGPVFTEAEFEKYRQGRTDVHVIRPAASENQK